MCFSINYALLNVVIQTLHFSHFFQTFLYMFTPSEIRWFKAGCLTEHPIENVLKNPN